MYHPVQEEGALTAQTTKSSTFAVQTERLTKDFGAGRGVFDLDLEVRRGEILGFLGPNGAGKSTTMRVLLGMLAPTSGTARLLGRAATVDDIEVRRRVGYLAGDFGLYPLTGGAVLDYFARLHGGIAPRRIAELAERLGADLARPIRELSSGNRQKLGLIQAFMHDPELLILDEPIAGLDPLVQRTFHELLREAADEGRSILLSSHTLSEVDRVADRVAILRAGRLVVVDELEHLRAIALRRWEVDFDRPPGAEEFRRLPGVRRVELAGRRLQIDFEGSADPIVKALARYEPTALHTHDGELEDVFLRYYGDGGG
jgi:beta-exotoxin I transport system ATP-binding protein